MQKTAVLSAISGAFSLKKRRFLKMILVFVDVENNYHTDYQPLSCNAKNRRFSSTKDNVIANIGCTHA